MRLIFLDIDGVLNYQLGWEQKIEWSYHEFKGHMYDQTKVQLIDDFCQEHSCKIVLSSTWRNGKSEGECISMIADMGFTTECIGKTETSPHGCRGLEIQDYIRRNISGNYKNYMIIDDDSDMLLMQANNFCHVDSYVGITPIGLYRAGYKLGWFD